MRIIIVLGQYLADDGTLSLPCRERCFYAYKLFLEGEGDTFLLSGGTVNEKAGISEGAAMKNYLVSLGVAEDSILTEENSKNTYENAKYCAKILKKSEYTDLILVSSSYHIYRWYFNPVRFFNWVFGLKASPKACLDSLIALEKPYNAQLSSVFGYIKPGGDLIKFLQSNTDKNVFVKFAGSKIRQGFWARKTKESDIDFCSGHIKDLYRLESLEVQVIE